MATGPRREPIHWMSWAGFGSALVSGVLALYGAMWAEKHLPDSPLRTARSTAAAEPAAPQPVWHERQIAWAETKLFGRPVTADIDEKILLRTTESSQARKLLQVVAYFAPFVLGIGAALTGGWAMKAVQASNGRRAGNTLAVFAMMIGGLAAVLAGCMIFSLYLWPLVPSPYGT